MFSRFVWKHGWLSILGLRNVKVYKFEEPFFYTFEIVSSNPRSLRLPIPSALFPTIVNLLTIVCTVKNSRVNIKDL